MRHAGARFRFVVAVLFATLATSLAACSAPSEMHALAGTYALTFGIDTLRLDSAGGYQRSFGPPSARAVDHGRWTLLAERQLVALHDLPSRWPEHGRYNYDHPQGWHMPDTARRTMIGLTIERSWRGQRRLGVKPEMGWHYVRVAQP